MPRPASKNCDPGQQVPACFPSACTSQDAFPDAKIPAAMHTIQAAMLHALQRSAAGGFGGFGGGHPGAGGGRARAGGHGGMGGHGGGGAGGAGLYDGDANVIDVTPDNFPTSKDKWTWVIEVGGG